MNHILIHRVSVAHFRILLHGGQQILCAHAGSPGIHSQTTLVPGILCSSGLQGIPGLAADDGRGDQRRIDILPDLIRYFQQPVFRLSGTVTVFALAPAFALFMCEVFDAVIQCNSEMRTEPVRLSV